MEIKKGDDYISFRDFKKSKAFSLLLKGIEISTENIPSFSFKTETKVPSFVP